MGTTSFTCGNGGQLDKTYRWGGMSSFQKVDTKDETLFPDLNTADKILEQEKKTEAYKPPKEDSRVMGGRSCQWDSEKASCCSSTSTQSGGTSRVVTKEEEAPKPAPVPAPVCRTASTDTDKEHAGEKEKEEKGSIDIQAICLKEWPRTRYNLLLTVRPFSYTHTFFTCFLVPRSLKLSSLSSVLSTSRYSALQSYIALLDRLKNTC